ncbi:hypothetical protein Zmor_007424 [Zophobas morio]|uniref:Uncharacterized protein n=1 Tax=Zophobas morio TaxID=2755281 RepID=A0AA38IVI8_9CUCU|nr:hypothetical protein Zmor_007424 [Zophobas morio]
MDLFETTLKVLENRSAAQENLTLSKQDLDQYEEYITELKQQLTALELHSNENTQILEVNNFSKLEFNSHSVETKMLFSLIHGYLQQTEESLSTISQRESVLNHLCAENDTRLKKAEQSFVNALKLMEILKKDETEKSLKEEDEIQKQICDTETQIGDAEQALTCTTQKYDEKFEELGQLRSELELLEDKVEMETQQQQSLIDEKESYGRQHLEEINSNNEMSNKIVEIEANMLSVSQKLQEILESNIEVLQKQISSQLKLEQLERETSELEMKILAIEHESDQTIQNMTQEIQSKKVLVEQTENKLADSKTKTNEITQEMQELNTKMNTLKDELATLQANFTADEKKSLENNNLEEIVQERDDLIKDNEKLVSLITDNEEKIKQKQKQLDLLRSIPNAEIVELTIKIKKFEAEAQKKTELENEISGIDLRNKSLQQNVEQHQSTIKELTATKQKLEREREENQDVLKSVALKCDLIHQEIKRLEAQKKERAKAVSKPPVKKTCSELPKQHSKKRSFGMSMESDSSIDGERLSYAEFMAKKKMLKENKKQKR